MYSRYSEDLVWPEDETARTVALCLFLVWCLASLALAILLTFLCGRDALRRRRNLSPNGIGLAAALLCFPVLVMLRIQHLEPPYFPILGGATLAAFVCCWSTLCSWVAWMTLRRINATEPAQITPAQTESFDNSPLLVRLWRGHGLLVWAGRVAALVTVYCLASGPALLACGAVGDTAIMVVYSPLRELGHREPLVGDVEVEYWGLWARPAMDPITPMPIM
jgi:hypothetical protein